ncbi:MAG: hypothetical protein LBT03_00970 [Holosporales bacterium]|nr:hypothetical protein [Holosporales bacterium]
MRECIEIFLNLYISLRNITKIAVATLLFTSLSAAGETPPETSTQIRKEELLGEIAAAVKDAMSEKSQDEQPTEDETTTSADPARDIKDANFELITAAQDKLIAILESLHSYNPAIFEQITNTVNILKIYIQSQADHDELQQVIVNLLRLIEELHDVLPNLTGTLNRATQLTTFLALIVNNEHGIIHRVSSMPPEIPLNQAEIHELLNDIMWQISIAQVPEEDDVFRQMLAAIPRMSYEGKPNIPSHFIYTIFNVINEELKKTTKKLESLQRSCNRMLKSIVDELAELATDLGILIESDRIARNTIEYLESIKILCIKFREMLEKLNNTAADEVTSVLKLATSSQGVLDEILAIPKPQEIFDDVPKN